MAADLRTLPVGTSVSIFSKAEFCWQREGDKIRFSVESPGPDHITGASCLLTAEELRTLSSKFSAAAHVIDPAPPVSRRRLLWLRIQSAALGVLVIVMILAALIVVGRFAWWLGGEV